MMNRLLFPPLALLIMLTGSCGDAGLGDGRFNAIILNEDGVVRSIEMGDSFEKVKAAEQSFDPSVESDNIVVEATIDDESDYTVGYYFDENGVYEIDVDVFVEEAADGDVLYDHFNQYLEGKYGSPAEDQEYLVWHGKSKRGLSLEVTLSADSDDSGHYINVNYYELEAEKKK